MMTPSRPAAGRASRTAARIPCLYCGNTGTVGGAPCPVCRPGGAR
jgi:hypothetical protein